MKPTTRGNDPPSGTTITRWTRIRDVFFWFSVAISISIVGQFFIVGIGGRPLAFTSGHYLHFGCNGFAGRVLWTDDPAVSLAWDVLGSRPRVSMNSQQVFVQLPLLWLFAGCIVIAWLCRVSRSSK